MNKVEKIKAELERLIKAYSPIQSTEGKYRIEAYKDLISFIDSLSDTEKDFSIKESVIPFGASDSELMEATYFIPQGYHAVIDGNKVIIKKGEEPVSNDLEEAACEYADGENPTCPCEDCLIKTFKAGAQWQKERDQSTIELAEDHAYLAGQEKIIAKACDWLLKNDSYAKPTEVLVRDFNKAMEE